MPLLLDTVGSGSSAELRGGNCLDVGLVNNMPDGAWQATERQFAGLIRAAATDIIVRLKLFSIAEVPRGELARAGLAARTRDIAALWDTPLDGLIVTGTEPRATVLTDEPYWSALSTLVGWAQENTGSTIWSCLAAHAAVLHADGIDRQRLDEKRFGLFDYDTIAPHPLLLGVPSKLRVPHSRFNDLPAAALAACGYGVLTQSAAADVDAFVRQEERGALFVFFQGHPEYETNTLAREFRRDVGRFLRGARDDFPAPPHGYFDEESLARIEDLRVRAINDRDDDIVAELPMAPPDAGLESAWRRPAVDFYRNWLNYLKDRKAERRAPMLPWHGGRREAERMTDFRPAADGSAG